MKRLTFLFVMLCLSPFVSNASENEDIHQWHNLIKIGCAERLERFHKDGGGKAKNMDLMIDRVIKTYRPESFETLLSFYNDFAFQKRPELGIFLDQNKEYANKNMLNLIVSRARDVLKLKGEDLKLVADILKGSLEKINARYVQSKQPPMPQKCTLLAALIMNRAISHEVVAVAFENANRPSFCSVDGEQVLTAKLLAQAQRKELLRNIYGDSMEAFAKKRYAQIAESDNEADIAEAALWLAAGLKLT